MYSVLHVEDDHDIREIAKLSLEIYGEFEVHQAEDGLIALEMVKTMTPDIVLMDYMMPGMTGEEVFAHWLEDPKMKDVPVVFLTAKAGEEDLERLRFMGAAKVLTKPFDPAELPEIVMSVLGSNGGGDDAITA